MITLANRLAATIRNIPDFPIPGVLYKDVTPVLGAAELFSDVIEDLANRYETMELTAVVGIEARGFIFGGALAMSLGLPFVPVRKPGKLPYEKISRSYALEYGTNTIEIHKDALSANDRIVILDDLLATGGTMAAAIELCQDLGAQVVEVAFMVELSFLNGREKLAPVPVYSQVSFGLGE